MPLSQAKVVFPTDVEGTLIEVATGPTIDNIFYYLKDGITYKRIIDGPYRAIWAGIVPGSNQLAKLQAVLNHAEVQEIVFDDSADTAITLTGTLTVPSGKVITFKNRNRFIGTATIIGGTFDGNPEAQWFANTITLTNPRIFFPYVPVKIFGAVGDDSTDDYASIQRTVDTVAKNDTLPRSVLFTNGHTFRHSQPIIVAKFNTSTNNYDPVTVNLIGGYGDENKISSKGAFLKPQYKDKFAIGFQGAKAGGVRSLNIVGQFTAPVMTDFAFYTSYLNEYSDVTARDTQYSPYAGIVVDPFKYPTVPADGGYPGLTSYYTQATGGGSVTSQGLRFDDLYISSFVVDIALSPNGSTAGVQDVQCNNIQIANSKVGFSFSKENEESNTFKNIAVWGTVHTVFSGDYYATGLSGHDIIDNVSITGKVNQLISAVSNDPIVISNVNADSIATVGSLDGEADHIIKDSLFKFTTTALPDKHIRVYRGSIVNSRFVKGNNDPISVYGGGVGPYTNLTFRDCTFDVEPLINYRFDTETHSVKIVNSHSEGVVESTKATAKIPVNGDFAIADDQNDAISYKLLYNNERQFVPGLPFGASSINPDGNREATVPVQAGHNVNALVVGDWIWGQLNENSAQLMGRVKSINVGASTFVLELIPKNVTNAVYLIGIYRQRLVRSFIRATPVAGTNQLTNVDWYGHHAPQVGDLYDAKSFIVNAPSYFTILTYNVGAKTMTVSANFEPNVPNRVTFYNGRPRHEIVIKNENTQFPSLTHEAFVLAGSTVRFDKTDNYAGHWEILNDGWLVEGTHDPADVADWVYRPNQEIDTITTNDVNWYGHRAKNYFYTTPAPTFYREITLPMSSSYQYLAFLKNRTIKFTKNSPTDRGIYIQAMGGDTINGASFYATELNSIEVFFPANGAMRVVTPYANQSINTGVASRVVKYSDADPNVLTTSNITETSTNTTIAAPINFTLDQGGDTRIHVNGGTFKFNSPFAAPPAATAQFNFNGTFAFQKAGVVGTNDILVDWRGFNGMPSIYGKGTYGFHLYADQNVVVNNNTVHARGALQVSTKGVANSSTGLYSGAVIGFNNQMGGNKPFIITTQGFNDLMGGDIWIRPGTSSGLADGDIDLRQGNYSIKLSPSGTGTTILENGDFEVLNNASGIILKSPNNTRWRVTVANDGSLTTTSL